jgi:UDP-N-acetylmuramate--alanine ligase
MERVPFYGMVVVCHDDPRLRALLPRISRRTVTYGRGNGTVFQITGSETELPSVGERPYSIFGVRYNGKALGDFQLHVPGAHNILNATAAIAVGIGLDIQVESIRTALENFRGVDRRFQLRGSVEGVAVIDDYGHHPTEIRATLAAARHCGYGKIHVIFQPHRYTRTQYLMDEFAEAFAEADTVRVLDIYPASESPIPGVTGEVLAKKIRGAAGRPANYVSSFAEAAEAVAAEAASGEMILTLGAGNVSQLGPQILDRLRARFSGAVPRSESRGA